MFVVTGKSKRFFKYCLSRVENNSFYLLLCEPEIFYIVTIVVFYINIVNLFFLVPPLALVPLHAGAMTLIIVYHISIYISLTCPWFKNLEKVSRPVTYWLTWSHRSYSNSTLHNKTLKQQSVMVVHAIANTAPNDQILYFLRSRHTQRLIELQYL